MEMGMAMAMGIEMGDEAEPRALLSGGIDCAFNRWSKI